MPKRLERRRGAGWPSLAIAISVMLILMGVPPGLSFELSADSITAGENVRITGMSEPNSENNFLTSFTMKLPVVSGRYSYETEIKVPHKPNRIAVTARDVQDLSAGVKMGIWITKDFNAQGGEVHLSAQDVPPGRYKLKVSGRAMPDRNEVPITVEAETGVKADSKGRYKLVIDTTGMPEGKYLIEGDGDVKSVSILRKEAKNASSTVEPGAGGQIREGVAGADEAIPPAQPGQDMGVAARLAEWLGL